MPLIKYERARILRALLINGAFAFPFRGDLVFLSQPFQETGRLKRADSAQVRHVGTLNGTVLGEIGQDHLLLLDDIESGLPDVGCLLPDVPIDIGAERVGTATACSVGLDQTGLYQFFECRTGRLLAFVTGSALPYSV